MGQFDSMQAPPRKPVFGAIADALGALNDYANKPDKAMPGGLSNPPLSMLAQALSLPSLAKTADRMSYGDALTNSKTANVPFFKPETADALMMAPISPRGALAAVSGGLGDAGAARAIFAGITAKTADKAALSQAEKLTASGADPRAIWKDTGWFKGGDGKWRFEIDDSKAIDRHYQLTPREAYQQARQEAAWSGGDPARAASMNEYAGMPANALKAEFKRTGGEIADAAIGGDKAKAMQLLDDRRGLDALLSEMGNRKAGPMSAYLKHGELGQAYPDVYKMHTRIDPELDAQGQYLRGSPQQGEQMVLKEKPTWTDARSTALHEMQHAVQQREGFARGGMPEMFDPKNAERARDILNWRGELEKFMQEKGYDPKTNADAWSNANGALANEYHQMGAADMMPSVDVRQEAIQYPFRVGSPDRAQLEKLVQEYGLDKQVTPRKPMDMYRSLAGEAEARAVQSRMKLNPQQRRDLFPLDSYDVPIGGLIYR